MKTTISHVLVHVVVVLGLTSCVGTHSLVFDVGPGAEPEPGRVLKREEPVKKPNISGEVALEEVIEYAKLSRWELVVAGSEVTAARGRLTQAGKWSNPEIEIEVEDLSARERKWRETVDSIMLRQSIPLTRSRTAARNAAGSELATVEAQARQKELAIIMEVKRAFYEVIYTQSLVNLLEEIQSAAGAFEASTKHQFEAGAVSKMELLKAGIEATKVRMEVQSAQRQLVRAKKALAAAIGSNAEQIGTCVGTLAGADLPQEKEAVEAALSNSYELVIAKHGIDAAKFRLLQARGERYPELEFGVGLERNFAVLENSLKFSLGVEIPLFDSKSGEVVEKKAELASAKARLLSLEVSIEGTVRGTLEEVGLRLASVQAYSQKLIPAAREALKLAEAGYKEGKFSFLDVLDAQRTLSEIKAEHLEVVKALNDALLELEELQACEPGKQEEER